MKNEKKFTISIDKDILYEFKIEAAIMKRSMKSLVAEYMKDLIDERDIFSEKNN